MITSAWSRRRRPLQVVSPNATSRPLIGVAEGVFRTTVRFQTGVPPSIFRRSYYLAASEVDSAESKLGKSTGTPRSVVSTKSYSTYKVQSRKEQARECMKLKRLSIATSAAALLVIGLLAAAPARADTFDFTSCHLSGGCGTATDFGMATLTQVGANVAFDLVLTSGNRFVETGAGGKELFLFNDSLSGSTITNITTTLNGTTVAIPGGLSGFTNLVPVMTGGAGTFTASVECTLFSDCNGGSTPNINDLHFTVTNATLAQLETANADGSLFVADILCGQTGCTGQTGIVDVSAVPEGGATGVQLGGVLVGLATLRRRFCV